MFDAAAYHNTLGKGMNYKDVEAVALSQAIRNELENFHGNFGDGYHGFITDDQMKRLNICIRKTVAEGLLKLDLVDSFLKRTKKGKEVNEEEKKAWDWFTFQCATFDPDYMEKPNTPELEKAFKKYVTGYKGIKDVKRTN
jgi:hypothetical protein